MTDDDGTTRTGGTTNVLVSQEIVNVSAREMFSTMARWNLPYAPEGGPKCVETMPPMYTKIPAKAAVAGSKRKMIMPDGSTFVALLQSIDNENMSFSYCPGVDGTVFPVPATNVKATVTITPVGAGCKVNYVTKMDLKPDAPADFTDGYKTGIEGVIKSASELALESMKVDLERAGGGTAVIVEDTFPDVSAETLWTVMSRWDLPYAPDGGPKCIATWWTGAGARRQMLMPDGHHFTALLQSVNEKSMSFSYCPGVDGTVFPVPATNVKATVTITPVGAGCKVSYVTKMDLKHDAPAVFTDGYKTAIEGVVKSAVQMAKSKDSQVETSGKCCNVQ